MSLIKLNEFEPVFCESRADEQHKFIDYSFPNVVICEYCGAKGKRIANKSTGTDKETNPKDAIGSDKMPMHLVSGIVKAYQAIAHFLGNVKYGSWNYRAKGARASVYRAALDRHMDAWWEGEDNDPDDNTPHLANALACINILIEAKEAGKLVDDRPPKSNYREVMTRLTPLVKEIKDRYKDKSPVHYTINNPE